MGVFGPSKKELQAEQRQTQREKAAWHRYLKADRLEQRREIRGANELSGAALKDYYKAVQEGTARRNRRR